MFGNKSIAFDKAYSFAIRIVKCCQWLQGEKKEYVLSKQLLRCGTSIAANLAEANGAISDADFSSKVSISYKECQETKYWLNLLKDTNYIEKSNFKSIINDAEEISKILFSILKTTRINNK